MFFNFFIVFNSTNCIGGSGFSSKLFTSFNSCCRSKESKKNLEFCEKARIKNNFIFILFSVKEGRENPPYIVLLTNNYIRCI